MKVHCWESVIKKQQCDLLLLNIVKILDVKIDFKYKLGFKFCHYTIVFKYVIIWFCTFLSFIPCRLSKSIRRYTEFILENSGEIIRGRKTGFVGNLRNRQFGIL